MTIADDDQNPRPQKKLAKSLDAIAALRSAMEQRLAESKRLAATDVGLTPPPPEEKPKAKPQNVPGKGNTSTEMPIGLYDPAEWSRIMMRIATGSQKLIMDFMERNKAKPVAFVPSFDPAHIGEAFLELSNRVLSDPESFVEAQLAYWQGFVRIWQTTLAHMQGKPARDAVRPSASDKRFKDREWQSNWLFDFLKQIYLLTTEQAQHWVQKETARLDPRMATKIEFAMRQMTDAAAPSNFWLTNPEVLRSVFESNGDNLIKGLENLLGDIERGQGQLRISMTDTSAFHIGQNIATTPGKVVYQNHLIQLIQYAPVTPSVKRTPLLILPPWINKYYILDLGEKKSFIRWLVSQGHTVFCVSWVNPDVRHATVNFDDYMESGALAAMREIKRITGETDINALGYCIGGTLLAGTLAYLKGLKEPRADLPQVASATYLVTMVDFAHPGDLGVFTDEEAIRIAEERMAKQGYLDAAAMATVFNLLRSNDLIWSYVVHNYLLGKEPAPFDILYWNSDATNMPAAMHSFYLRKMYMENEFAKPCGVSFKNVPIDLRTIDTPSFLLATREDHIAPWRSTYAGTQLYKGPVKFVLSGSGHIAGVINPVDSNKYGYWTNDKCPVKPDDWFKRAEPHEGSWWPEWLKWLNEFAGDSVPARKIQDGIEDAPGSYVKVRADGI